MLPGGFALATLEEVIEVRSELLSDGMLNDNWYLKTNWLVALRRGNMEFWAHTAVDKTSSVPVTPVALSDPAGCETEAPEHTVAITTMIRDLARMLREKHWGLYIHPLFRDEPVQWMRNLEIDDTDDYELGYLWAY